MNRSPLPLFMTFDQFEAICADTPPSANVIQERELAWIAAGRLALFAFTIVANRLLDQVA